MLITQCPLAHVGKLDGTLRASVHELITADGVEFGRGDDLGKLLHIRGLDIHNVEALVLDVEVPQVNSQIVTADKCLAITVHRDAIYVIRMGVCVCSPWDSSDHGIMVCQSREFQGRGVLEGSAGGTRKTADGRGRSHLIGKVVLRDHLERFVEYLPQLNRLVVRRKEKV